MNYKVRVYIGEMIQDVILSAEQGAVTVGSSDTDTLKLNCADIVAGQLSFSFQNGAWSCTNNITGETAAVSDGSIFVLSMQYRIAASVYSLDVIPQRSKLKVGTTVTIGRDFECLFLLSDKSVGRKHAVVTTDESGTILRDLNSRNGTYVNGKKTVEATLQDGDIISIGKFDILYHKNALELCVPEQPTTAANNTEAESATTSAEVLQEVLIDTKEPTLKIIEQNTVNPTALKPEENILPEGSDIKPEEAVQLQPEGATESDGRILFKRSPRLKLEIPTGEIEIQAPPSLGEKPEQDWMDPLMVVNPLSLITGARNYKKQKTKFENKEAERAAKYSQYLQDSVKKIEDAQKKQLESLRYSDPSVKECLDMAQTVSQRLWERGVGDSDFLSVRLGVGEVDSCVKIKTPQEAFSLEEDVLKTQAQAIPKKYKKVKNAPVIRSLQQYPIFGVVGNHAETNRFISNLAVQLSTHHCYTELKLVSVYDQKDSCDLEWMKQLPHCFTDDQSDCFVGSNKAEAELLFDNFAELFKKRELLMEAKRHGYGQKNIHIPYFLFVITAPDFLTRRDAITKFLFQSKNSGLGVGVVFAVETMEQLPIECELIINVSGQRPEVYDKNQSTKKQTFVMDASQPESLESFARNLSRLYCENNVSDDTIPEQYSLFEMLGIQSADELSIEDRWSQSDVTRSIAAPMGIYGKNKLLYLDLHEEEHGPHGLVAGKTGSGKSEVLLSYLVSMASLYHPHEVQFVIIDFKGGGMAQRLERLPHLNTTITNIDGSGTYRSLEAINAELVRRQKVLSEASAIDIHSYLKLYKAGKVSDPLPHLVMVVDEFAELKQNYPEFMKNLISAARIGRSLGIHLILATQSPAGVVDEQIWSNSNFKLSLMVLDETSSNAVLKSPLAAHITVPGRGYLKVGNGELFELFQSGYSGTKTADSKGEELTQLDAVIEAISCYCAKKEIEDIPGICLPPLPKKLAYRQKKITAEQLSIGLFDDPKAQIQGDCNLDIFHNNTMIIGSGQTGKTNLLQTVIRSLTSCYTPKEVNLYIIDFSSMFLKNYEGLNHIGGVVTVSEDEKLKNLFKLLHNEIDLRKAKQLSVGVSSFAAYREAGYTDLAHIVVLVDNLTSLKETYFQDDDALLRLCADGINYGITFIIANAQTSGIGPKYLSYFANRIALYCNDSTEYLSLLEHCRETLPNIAGRCLVSRNKQFCECQTYLAFDGGKEFERANQIKDYIQENNSKHKNLHARQIPCVPDVIYAKDFLPVVQNVANRNFAISVGIDYTSVEPVTVTLGTLGIVGVSGKEASGKHNFLKYVINVLNRVYPEKTDVYIFDSIHRKMADMHTNENVKAYEILAENAKAHIQNIEAELSERYAQLASGNHGILDESNLIVLMINSIELLDELCADTKIVGALRNITGKYKNMNVVIFVGNYENKSIPYGANEFVKKIKEDKHIFFFDNLSNLKIFDMPLAVMRAFKKQLTLGDGYYIRDNEAKKLKTVFNGEKKS